MAPCSALIMLTFVQIQEKYVKIGVAVMDFAQGASAIATPAIMEVIVA